jgi:hypothetical protein
MKSLDTISGMCLLVLGATVFAWSPASGGQETGISAAGPVVTPVYHPPKRGMPGGRLGGGTRSADQHVTVLMVLAPDHTGLTIREQPTLYWYLSKQTNHPVYLTVIDAEAMKTVLDVRLPAPAGPGVQAIRLGDHGLHLAPGLPYQWFVALMVDPEHRSKDIIAGGMIERIAPSQELASKLTLAGGAERTAVYAEAGLWYDAVEAISEEIAAVPNDSGLRKQRASLLDQVGLPEISAHDLHGGT